MRPPPFTYGLENDLRYRYEQAHIVTQLPRVMVLLDDFQPEVIINFAALCEVGLSWLHAADYYETNVIALVRLTNELAIRGWFRKFVQIGSSEVYGSVTDAVDEDYPVNPSSPYAASKAAFDMHLRAIARHQAFRAVIVMPSNGYCEGQTLNRIIPKTIIAALTGKRMPLQGGGVVSKSYLHADDISAAIMLVMEKGSIGETYNCGPKSATTIYSIAAIAAMKAGIPMYKMKENFFDITNERTGQDSLYLLNSDKIKALGWKGETVDRDTGFERMVAWVKANPALLTMDSTYTHRP